MDLKRGIDLAVEKVVDDLKSHAKKVTSNSEIAQVGTISANGDTQIGRFLAEAMQKVDNDGVITVEETKLTGLQTMLPLLESVVQTGKPLLIVAEEVEGEALATLVVNKLAVG